MIKKLLTPVLLSFLSFSSIAQCTIDPSAFPGSYQYGTSPDSAVFNGSSMATALELQPYDFTLQIRLATDTATSMGSFPIIQVTIDSILGLPDGITYSINPSDTILGGAYACLRASGIPAAGTASGGPNNDGIYPVTAYVTATLNIFTVLTPFPSTNEKYRLRVIDNTTGLLELNTPGTVALAYNGSDATATLVSSFKEDLLSELIDLNGKRLQSFLVHEGTTTLNTSSLPTGIYLVKAGNTTLRLMKF